MKAIATAVFAIACFCGFPLLSEDPAIPTLAIIDFTNGRGAPSDEGRKLAELLSAELSAQGGVALLERSHFAEIMEEHGLSSSHLSSPEKAVELGKLLGADYVLSGRLYTLDGDRRFNGKLVFCRSSAVKGISESYGKDDGNDNILSVFSSRLSAYVKKGIAAPPEKQ